MSDTCKVYSTLTVVVLSQYTLYPQNLLMKMYIYTCMRPIPFYH